MSDVVQLPNGKAFLVQTVFTKSQFDGVTILVVVSCLSLVAVIGLLVVLAISAVNTRSSQDKAMFVRTHIAAYLVSLLICNFLQCVASLIGTQWIQNGGIRYGDRCTAQGILKHLSHVGTALWTLVIAANTFCILFLEIKVRRFVLLLTLVSGWFGLGAVIMAGPTILDTVNRGPFYGIAGSWCWISEEYRSERILLDYMFMITSAVLSFLMYILIYLRLRGNIVVNGWYIRFRTDTSNGGNPNSKPASNQALSISKQMLLYPVAFTIMFLPMAIIRLCMLTGRDVSYGAIVFGNSIFMLSGLVNVILFTTTRRILPPNSLMLGKWNISRPQPIASPSIVSEADPYYPDCEPYIRPAYDEKSLPPISASHLEAAEVHSPERDHNNESRRERRSTVFSVILAYDDVSLSEPVAPLNIRKQGIPSSVSSPERESHYIDDRKTIDDFYSLYGRPTTGAVPPVPPLPQNSRWGSEFED